MARKQHKPEEIVAKLRQVEVLAAQGKAVAETVRSIGVAEQLRDELLKGEVFHTVWERGLSEFPCMAGRLNDLVRPWPC